MTDQFQDYTTRYRIKMASVLLLLTATVAASSAIANEGGEVFALTGQPTVLFDGGSGPLTGVHKGIPYEIIQGFAIAQGDMVLGRVLANGEIEGSVQTRGIGQASAFERWADGIIPYQFGNSVSQSLRDRTQEAIAKLNDRTTIKLVSRTNENADRYNNYINFELSGGCASFVGKKGGEQTVWIADSCTVGSLIHEVGHAIGLFHEHTRPDRDNFVTVHLNNVSSGKELNFDKIEVSANNYSDYDYGSIMHYGEYFFSRNGERSISVPDGIQIGQRDALSDNDIDSINAMYATDLKLSVSTEASGEDTGINIVVANIGELGANTLQLTAQWGDDADWLSMSTNSGWECQQFGPELRCTRPTMIENTDSSFSILVDEKERPLEELMISVISRTQDNDLSNNAFNDSVNSNEEPKPSGDVDVAQSAPSQDSDSDSAVPDSGSNEPSTGSESPASTDATDNSDTTDEGQSNIPTNSTSLPQTGAAQPDESSDGGGGAAIYLLMLVLGASLRKRR